jgi:hypothetical protein
LGFWERYSSKNRVPRNLGKNEKDFKEFLENEKNVILKKISILINHVPSR